MSIFLEQFIIMKVLNLIVKLEGCGRSKLLNTIMQLVMSKKKLPLIINEFEKDSATKMLIFFR